MSLSANRRLLLAKIETTYGEDSLPGAANALMVTSALDGSPAEAETVERDTIKPFYGQSERLMSSIFSKLTFEIELAGHSGGVIGRKPAIDNVLRACGFKGEQQTLTFESLTQLDGVATAEIGDHTYKVGQKIEVLDADGEEYNGLQVISAVTATTISFEIQGDPVSPDAGEAKMKASYIYTPITDDIPSCTFYYFVDGVIHRITGAKGTFSLDISVKQVPKLRFDFTGINNKAEDGATIKPDMSGFTIPMVANTKNTTDFSLLGHSAALESFVCELGNEVTYRTLIGKEYVEILNRKASGSMVFEATKVGDVDYWTTVQEQQEGAMGITHGRSHGNKVSILAQRVLLDSPKYSTADNVMMLNVGVSVLPVEGNDELTIKFH